MPSSIALSLSERHRRHFRRETSIGNHSADLGDPTGICSQLTAARGRKGAEKKQLSDLSKPLISVAILATVIAVLVAAPALAARRDPACSVTPGSVGSGQSYAVSAIGLPGGSVNLVLSVPDGSTQTSSINPAGGAWTGEYAAPYWNGETGPYVYKFVGKVTWPQGSYSQVYATCSVQVSEHPQIGPRG